MSVNDPAYPRVNPAFASLSNAHISVLLDVAGGVPVVVHWGPGIGVAGEVSETGLAGMAALRDLPIPHGGLDVVAPISLLPEHGAGYLGRPGLEGRRADGTGWAPCFELVEVETSDAAVIVHGIDHHAGLPDHVGGHDHARRLAPCPGHTNQHRG